MYNFAVITERVSCGNDTLNFYGIKVSKNGEGLFTFKNITFSEDVIKRFAGLCNKHQISPVHFDDVLENFLTDFETL